LPELVKMGADNPDALYQSVTIDGAQTYRITGTRGTVHYLGIGAYSGNYGEGRDAGGTEGYVDDPPAGADGRIEIWVGPEPHPGTWIATTPAASQLIIRQFFLDRQTERAADLRVERVSPGPAVPPPLRATALERALRGAAGFVFGTADRFIGWAELFARRPNELNLLPGDEHERAHGDPNQIFRHGYWTLEPGQALVVEFVPPECFYWNFQLDNWWMESLDYRFHRITVNKHSALAERDGTVRLVVAPEDPGWGNWIDTAGHRHGTMGLRWNQAVHDVQPQCRVVAI
jgi:hypothetical protein